MLTKMVAPKSVAQNKTINISNNRIGIPDIISYLNCNTAIKLQLHKMVYIH